MGRVCVCVPLAPGDVPLCSRGCASGLEDKQPPPGHTTLDTPPWTHTHPRHPLDTTVNKRAVRTLLECFLVFDLYSSFLKSVNTIKQTLPLVAIDYILENPNVTCERRIIKNVLCRIQTCWP